MQRLARAIARLEDHWLGNLIATIGFVAVTYGWFVIGFCLGYAGGSN